MAAVAVEAIVVADPDSPLLPHLYLTVETVVAAVEAVVVADPESPRLPHLYLTASRRTLKHRALGIDKDIESLHTED